MVRVPVISKHRAETILPTIFSLKWPEKLYYIKSAVTLLEKSKKTGTGINFPMRAPE